MGIKKIPIASKSRFTSVPQCSSQLLAILRSPDHPLWNSQSFGPTCVSPTPSS